MNILLDPTSRGEIARVALTRKDDPDFVRRYLFHMSRIMGPKVVNVNKVWRAIYGSKLDRRKGTQ
jgi:hypothetical protein